MENFIIGDRVMAIFEDEDECIKEGMKGTVMGREWCNNIIVAWDGFKEGHDGDGRPEWCGRMDMWYTNKSCMRVIPQIGDKVKGLEGQLFDKVGTVVFIAEEGDSFVVEVDNWGGGHNAPSVFSNKVGFNHWWTSCFEVELVERASDRGIVKEEVEVREFVKGDRVFAVSGRPVGFRGTVIGYGSDKCSIGVEFDGWGCGHNAGAYYDGFEGDNCWFCNPDEIKHIIEDKSVKIYNVGDYVKCLTITPENHEKLIRGMVYTVAGVSVFDGNVIYAVKDASGNTFHSMDRFEKVGEADMEQEVGLGFIRCDMVVEDDVEPIEIEVGDIVKVVNTGAVYSSYRSWYEEHLEGMGFFVDNDDPEYTEFEVLVIAPHGSFASVKKMYGIREVGGDSNSQVFIIGDYGIEFVDRPLPVACCKISGTEKKQTCAGAGITAFDPMFTPIDMVSNPPHYTDGGIETIDFIQAKMTPEAFEGFCLGNALKYISRQGKKGDAKEDLKKAVWYLQKVIGEPVVEVEDVDAPSTRPLTSKQIGFIAGLTKELDVDRYALPTYLAPVDNYKDLTEAEASILIDRLLAIKKWRYDEC